MIRKKKMLTLSFLTSRLKYLFTRPEVYLESIEAINRASEIFKVSRIRMTLHAVRLLAKEGYYPKEAFEYGLLNPAISEDDLKRNASGRKLNILRSSLNPRRWVQLVDHKDIFYRYCTAHNLPVPECYALFFRNMAGWSYRSPVMKGRDRWLSFLDQELPSEFVIKPIQGMQGRDVRIFARSGHRFVDALNRSYTATELIETLRVDRRYDGFIIQERLRNHPDLFSLSPSEYLQTVRVVTLVDRLGEVRLLQAFFKAIVGDNVTDNICSDVKGKSGNLLVPVSIGDGDGTLQQAFQETDDGLGSRYLNQHPDTNVPFAGFQLPLWQELCHLVKESALIFLPVRTIGWDVAMTPEGPVLVEGNTPYGAMGDMRSTIHALSQG